MAIDTLGLPRVDTRARVNVYKPARERRLRLGRRTFRFDADTMTAIVFDQQSGETLATGIVETIEGIGADAWQLTMVGGDQWAVMAGGCGCGG